MKLHNKFTVLYWQFVLNGWKNYTSVTLLNDFENDTLLAPSLSLMPLQRDLPSLLQPQKQGKWNFKSFCFEN